mgnify:CR=1
MIGGSRIDKNRTNEKLKETLGDCVDKQKYMAKGEKSQVAFLNLAENIFE